MGKIVGTWQCLTIHNVKHICHYVISHSPSKSKDPWKVNVLNGFKILNHNTASDTHERALPERLLKVTRTVKYVWSGGVMWGGLTAMFFPVIEKNLNLHHVLQSYLEYFYQPIESDTFL